MPQNEPDDVAHDFHVDHPTGEIQGCYVFTPENSGKGQRPRKRREISNAATISNEGHEGVFVPLLDGFEGGEHVRTRLEAFKSAWAEIEGRLESILQEVNVGTVNEVVTFLKSVESTDYGNRLPTALLTAGPSVAASASLFQSIGERMRAEGSTIINNITAAQSPNLKTVLKHIIQHALNDSTILHEDNASPITRQGARLLNYDLQLLYEHVKQHSVSRTLLFFQNSESFDASVLADLIDVLCSWNDRIHFVLLFEVATSVTIFQEKLPRASIRKLRGTTFEVAPMGDTLELIFKTAASLKTQHSMRIGAGISNLLVDRQKGHLQSIRAFTQALKYAYMAHFFVNPLSVFLGLGYSPGLLQEEHYEAIRNLSSFRRYVEDLLETHDFEKARRLLDDDEFLHKTVIENLQHGQDTLVNLLAALDIVYEIHASISTKSDLTWSDLYVKGMSGELADSSLLRDLLLSVRKLPSDVMSNLLDNLSHASSIGLSTIQDDLKDLTASINGDGTPLRSQHDLHHKTLRTTVVAQKVGLSKQKFTLSKQDTAYSKIVDRVDAKLNELFAQSLINPQHLFLNEIFIYDLKSPHRDVFTPKPRFAVERALSSPHDYLGCDCCGVTENVLSASQPPTAILYQLYLESGALINIADLWSAFHAIVGGEQDNDDESREQEISALFSRALAELRYLGMIKNSRKKTDHLVKLSWKGL